MLGANSYVDRSYRGKTGEGAFLCPLPPPSWIGLNTFTYLLYPWLRKRMAWRGAWSPPFQFSSYLQFLSPPVIQGSKVPLFSLSISYSVQKVWTPPFYRKPLIWLSNFFIFFMKPTLLARLFRKYYPNEIPDKNKNKLMLQSYFLIFRRLKVNVKCFFKKQHFYKQHQVEI